MENQGLPLDKAKRKLVSIQTVKSITPIPDADAIVVAEVLGWKVVVRKNEFKVGDKGAFFEVDSFLPDVPEYSFIGPAKANPITKGTDGEFIGHRLHTVKLRKQISQGLFVKFENLSNKYSGLNRSDFIKKLNSLPVGTDITSFLGVQKYEKPEFQTAGDNRVVGSFDTRYVMQTDETRIQEEPNEYKQLQGKPYYISSKIDGTSTTIIKNEYGIRYFGHNGLLVDNSFLEKFCKKTGITDKLQNYSAKQITLQGEFYGAGIQSNRLGIIKNRWAVFTIVIDGVRLPLKDMIKVAGDLDLELPTIIEIGSDNQQDIDDVNENIKQVNLNRKFTDPSKVARDDLHPQPNPIKLITIVHHVFNYSIDKCIELINGSHYHTVNRQQEGGVFRPLTKDDAFNPTSFKVINNKYLLKNKL